MKVAISNIAWPAEHDAVVAEELIRLGMKGIEIAPTRLWPSPLEVTDPQVDACRRFWESYGLSIVAAQALLFSRPDLTLFSDAETRLRTLGYLRGVSRLCARLGARALVFGSPRNRRAGERDRAEVQQEAIDFFGRLAEVATAEGTTVVLEANPPEYGADFITTAVEAMELVRTVNHPGFRLHLDTACMTLVGDDPDFVIPTAAPLLAHFHVSEPQLVPIGDGPIDHARFASSLESVRYDGWVSIEMRASEPFDLLRLQRSVSRVQTDYQATES